LENDIILKPSDALIIGDVQIDFLPGGALPIQEGEQIITILNDYINLFKKENKIFAIRDWHPANHVSFTEQGGPWPPHCIQGSDGAKFHPDIKLPPDTEIVSKGTNPTRESYSGFDGTDLSSRLRTNGISRVFIGGVATDYCVKYTVLDALSQSLEVVLLADAIKGINVQPRDSELAVERMISEGAKTALLHDFPEPLVAMHAQEPIADELGEKPLEKATKKKKARLRSRGPYRKARAER
jgi:nicotinamidase-related amidase